MKLFSVQALGAYTRRWIMNKAGITHEMDMTYVYAIDKEHMVFKLKAAKDDLKKVELYYVDKYLHIYGKADLETVGMERIGSYGPHDYYECIIKLHVLSLRYFFKVTDMSGQVAYVGEIGVVDQAINKKSSMFEVPQIARAEEAFCLPDWMKDSVIYQVFPDRFYPGNSSTDQGDNQDWYSDVSWDSKLGGTIKGITDKLSYLEELGINVLYLNPIFTSRSNHKYDTGDYMNIDPEFGSKDDFKELVDRAHDRGIRVVIDGVFNHCGIDFWAFQDVLNHQEDSEYVKWFHINSFPINTGYDEAGNRIKPSYESFGYFGGMPKLNMANQQVRDYIFKMTAYWSSEFGIDGWRLDASDEISFDFWRAFRQHIKAINSEIGLIGEVWYDANQWLLGDQYDSVMNYKFRTALVDFIAEKSIQASTFSERLQYTRLKYKNPVQIGLWNLIGSHDTERFLTLCQEDKDLLKLGAILQFTLPGNPLIYYGDEIGMFGGKDPDCRKGMVWKEDGQDLELFNFYKQLISLRKQYPLMANGDYKEIQVDDDAEFLLYQVSQETKSIYVAINNGKRAVSLQGEPYEGSYDILNKCPLRHELGSKKGLIFKKL